MAERGQPPSAVIFDIGNVLLDWDPAYLYEKLIPDPEERRFFLETVVPMSWHLEHDRGRPFAESIAERQRLFPRYAGLIAAYRARWEETIAGPIWGSVAILEALAEAGVPLYAITNYAAETFPDARRRFGFLALFRDIVVSGEEGVIKPEPKIFHRALARFGITAGQALFIDDNPANIEAAAALGFHTHRFLDPGDLSAALRRAKLLTERFDLDEAALRAARRWNEAGKADSSARPVAGCA